MSVIVFSCMFEVSPPNILFVYSSSTNCFNSSISGLRDSHLFLKFHQQVQKQLSFCDDFPFKKVQPITTTVHTDFPKIQQHML